MLTCFRSFKQEESKDYYELGGPRSFHKFTFKKTELILMGERHRDMPQVLVDQYTHVFVQFIEKNNHIKLLLEKRDDIEKDGKTFTTMSFIDYMGNLPKSPHLEVINSDDREVALGFQNFYYFLGKRQELQERIIDIVKEQKVKPPSQIPFADPDFVKLIEAFSKPVVSIYENKNAVIISPEIINEFLNENFEHAPKRNNVCALL